MTLQQAEDIQRAHCVETLTKVADGWFLNTLSKHTKGVTQDKLVEAAKELADESEDVQFHADKAIELGFNKGRLGARARFLLEGLQDGLEMGVLEIELPEFIKAKWGEESYVDGDIPERQGAVTLIRHNLGL